MEGLKGKLLNYYQIKDPNSRDLSEKKVLPTSTGISLMIARIYY
jgi:hypothetical protein